MVRSVARSVVPVCGLVSGPVGDPVGDPVGGPVGHLVDGPVSDWSGPCDLWSGRNTSCSIQRLASFKCSDIDQQAGLCSYVFQYQQSAWGLESQSDRPCREFRVSHGPVLRWRCGAVALLLRCCCGVAVLLRWCCGSVAVVRSVVPVDGPVSGH